MATPRRTQAETDTPASPPATTETEIWARLADDIAARYQLERDALVAHALETTGRPSAGALSRLADPPAITALLTSMDTGLSLGQAAIAAGLDPKTAKTLTDQGQRDYEQGVDSARAALYAASQMAWERRRQRLLGRIASSAEAGPQYWTAAAWLLERGYGQAYKLQQVTGGGNVIVNVGVYAPTDVRIGGESVSSPVIDVRPVPVSD